MLDSKQTAYVLSERERETGAALLWHQPTMGSPVLSRAEFLLLPPPVTPLTTEPRQLGTTTLRLSTTDTGVRSSHTVLCAAEGEKKRRKTNIGFVSAAGKFNFRRNFI